jgi:hypothetical protein
MSSKDDVRRLIINYTRRLQKLKEQKAIEGISSDPKILIEIEDIETEIEILQKRLNETASTVKNRSPITTHFQEDKIIKRDVFISYASEDKHEYVHPLVEVLKSLGITYWLDEAEIKWGDKISRKINQGLSDSKYVLVLLTENFINKNWPLTELESAFHHETASGDVIVLPVLIAPSDVIFTKLPLLRDKLYLKWEQGAEGIAQQLLRLLARNYQSDWVHYHKAEYSGKVWIRIMPKPANRKVVHNYKINWGPWE